MVKSRRAPGNISGWDYTGDPKPPSAFGVGALKSRPLGFQGVGLLIKRSFPKEGGSNGEAAFGYDAK